MDGEGDMVGSGPFDTNSHDGGDGHQSGRKQGDNSEHRKNCVAYKAAF